MVAITLAAAALSNCSERPTGPPGSLLQPSAAALDRGERDGGGAAATLAWELITRNLVANRKLSPINAIRLYALHSVADYAALVAVSHGDEDADAEDGGNGRASYEARRGAVAGASAEILSALSPVDADGLEAQLAAFGRDASGWTHPQYTRGVSVGRAAGRAMAEWASQDGFALPWNESMRNASGPGIWEGAPAVGTAQRPPSAGYQFPTMTPYFLRAVAGHSAQSQFRAPPPPAFSMVPGSAFRNDLDEVRHISDTRTVQQSEIAYFWNLSNGTITALGYWDEQAASFIQAGGLDEQDAAHLLAIMNAAAMDATIGCWDSKFRYFMLRPSMADPLITRPTLERPDGPPNFPYGLPNHPSYPSGHSCVSSASAAVLSHYFPSQAAQLDAQVIEAGLSRIYGGIHYRFDVDAGQALGRATAAWAMAYDRDNGLLTAVGLAGRKDR
ncbi:MAG TPA: phosphatase PAP2 family protein [Gemmatimonadaceae bacterium]|nr:phosphatase PAP2 family protein [Gemmatimonadaceae bacterium]